METGVNLFVWIVALLVCLPMGVVIVEVVCALGCTIGRQSPDAKQAFPSTVVLIPAHNEACVIGPCLESVIAGLPQNCRLLCVAHNCSDTTADIARQFGAEVIEVADAGDGGKPDALKAGLRWLDGNPPEVVVIIDADSLVGTDAVSVLARAAIELNRPVTGDYRFTTGDAKPGVATLSAMAVLLKNFVRPLGLHSLGLPCLLNGSGSAYPFRIIRNAPHGEGSIAEDYQLSIDLLRMGYPTTFVPEATVVGQLPAQAGTALRQRRRWEHGHLYLALHTAPLLLLEGVLRLDRNRTALALELAVPPLVLLGLMWGIATGLMLMDFVIRKEIGPLGMLLGAAAAFSVAILAAWIRFAGIRQTLAALAIAPRYLMWKLPLYRDFLSRRETRWIKTDRD